MILPVKPSRDVRVLIVDLNNFATFPTLAVGILVASLRSSGIEVDVLCPLAHGVPALAREKQEGRLDHWLRRIHLTTNPKLRGLRNVARNARLRHLHQPNAKVVGETERAMAIGYDLVLLSAYLDHHPTVEAIGRCAQQRGIPMVLGGPMFNLPDVAREWLGVPGLTALFGGEADLGLPAMVRSVLAGEDLSNIPGVILPNGDGGVPSSPLRDMDSIPIPDFRDFPWEQYPLRVLPIMTARGCGWGRCVFCSDVVSASGRTFRSRSLALILDEIEEQARRHSARHFLFLDLKLNSNLEVWRGLASGIRERVPDAEWIGTVHVGNGRDNGLGQKDLEAAVAGGMRRISFGLESGSQRLLDSMKKGTSIERCSEFLHAAHGVGLSVRCTAFQGLPGETAQDVRATQEFLDQHAHCIDRIRFNDFSVMSGTSMHSGLLSSPSAFPELDGLQPNHSRAKISYRHENAGAPAYRAAKRELLETVYRINRKPLRAGSEALDGLM